MKLGDIFNIGASVATSADKTQAKVAQTIDEAKDAAITAYTVTTTLQLLSTVSIMAIAYVTIMNYRKGK